MSAAAIARMPAGEFFGSRMRALPFAGASITAAPRHAEDVGATLPKIGPRLVLHGRGSPRRAELEAFVHAEFRRHFDADVSEFMPTFLALHDAAGRIGAAVGCRSAALEPLFLEVYTERPIEAMIEERTGTRVAREQVVEIGSLACRDGRTAMAIVRALVPYLVDAGFGWVAFTGADTVVNVLGRLNLEPMALCAADSRKLGASRSLWGSYYDHHPIVMAGRLLEGVEILGSRPRVQ